MDSRFPWASANPRERALVIHDESAVRSRLIAVLEAEGFDVAGVVDAPEWRRTSTTRRFDFLVCKLGLPGTLGDAICMEAKRRHPGIRCLLIAAGSERTTTLEAWLSPDFVLWEPFTSRELIRAIGRLRDGRLRRRRVSRRGLHHENARSPLTDSST